MVCLSALATWRFTPHARGATYTSADHAIRISILDTPSSIAGACETFVTPEGEPARVVEHERGVTASVGDGPVLLVEGSSRALRSIVMELARECGLALGANRRRSFEYASPHDWSMQRAYQRTLWSRDAARITVFDARPVLGGPVERLDRFLWLRTAGVDMVEATEREPIIAGGMSGLVSTAHGTMRGEPLRCTAAVLSDGRFNYCAHLETHPLDRESRVVFHDLVTSFRPVMSRPIEIANLAWMAD